MSSGMNFLLLWLFSLFSATSLLQKSPGLYNSWRFTYVHQEVWQLLITWLHVIFVMLVAAYAMKVSSLYSRRVLISWMVLTPIVLSLFRFILRKSLHALRKKERNTKSVIIVGVGEQAQHLVAEIRRLNWLGLRIVGYFDDIREVGYQPDARSSAVVIGKIDKVLDYVNQHSIDMIFMALPTDQGREIQSLINQLSDSTAQTYMVPDLFVSSLLHTRWGYLGSIPLLGVHDRPFTHTDGIVKRLEDMIFASVILVLIAVPMLMIAIIIKLTSSGPVLFKQTRYGLSGNKITVWKFRSMSVCEDGDTIKQVQKNDDRMTAVGRFLRKTSLDELPQFINVLQGHMSIVGPRPHAVAHNELYRQQISDYMLRHTVRPGITGWAQVNGWRGETDTLDKMEQRIDHDLWYIKNWSLWLDVKIIALTIFRGFVNERAY